MFDPPESRRFPFTIRFTKWFGKVEVLFHDPEIVDAGEGDLEVHIAMPVPAGVERAGQAQGRFVRHAGLIQKDGIPAPQDASVHGDRDQGRLAARGCGGFIHGLLLRDG